MKKKKTIVGLIAMAAIASVAIFTGCVEEPVSTPSPSAPTPELTGIVEPSSVKITWVEHERTSNLVAHYSYKQGMPVGVTIYPANAYFKVTSGSGKVKINTHLSGEERTDTFFVEVGKTYKLDATVRRGRAAIVENKFYLVFSSPAATSKREVVIKGNFQTLWLGNVSLKEVRTTTTPPRWILQVWEIPKGSGSISASVGSLAYNSSKGYHSSYESGTEVTLTAIPAPGYVFNHWSMDATGKSPSVTVRMTGNRHINAHFSKIEK